MAPGSFPPPARRRRPWPASGALRAASAPCRAGARPGRVIRLPRNHSQMAPARHARGRTYPPLLGLIWARGPASARKPAVRRRCGRSAARSPSGRRRARAGRAPRRAAGAAAPERRIRASASGSMIGSSQEPCTMKGRAKGGVPARSGVTSAAVPVRSSSRCGIEAEPASASCTAGPSDFHVLDGDFALLDLQRHRDRIVLACGRCGNRRRRTAAAAPAGCSNCSTSRPDKRAVAAGQAGVAVERVRHGQHAVAAAVDRES